VNFGLQAAGALLARPLGPERSLTLGLCAGNRNLGVVVAALGAQAPFELVAFLALAQIPIYVAPVLIGPLARRFVPPAGGSVR
jgi:BASS family bile acid:Na+ symporter